MEFTTGTVQLEVLDGPVTWIDDKGPMVRSFVSPYFYYAPVGTYSVRAIVTSPETGQVAYSSPISVENPKQEWDPDHYFECGRGDNGKIAVGWRGDEVSRPLDYLNPMAVIYTCGERKVGSRSVVVQLNQRGDDCLHVEMVEPAIPIAVTRRSSGDLVSDNVWNSLPYGTYRLEATCDNPLWNGVVAKFVVTR